mgnify:CR=1 FL=1
MNNSEEISIISKLVLQQIGLLDSLSDCQKLKKDLINQAILLLKAIAVKSGGHYVIEKEFYDSALDEQIVVAIKPQENGDIHLEIEEVDEK